MILYIAINKLVANIQFIVLRGEPLLKRPEGYYTNARSTFCNKPNNYQKE